jgi:PAS domain S-box-containing protein
MTEDRSVLQNEGAAVLSARIEELKTQLATAECRATDLAHEKRQVESLLERAPVGIAQFDLDLRFVRINEFLAAINGLPVAAHLGRTVAEVVPTLLPAVQEVTARILATGEPVLDHEFIGETPREPGVTRIWKESWYPVLGPAGDIAGFSVIVEEVTAHKRVEAALHERNRAEEQLTRDRDAVARLQALGAHSAIEGELEHILLQLVDGAIAIAGADFGNIQILDPERGGLRIAAQRGLPQWWLEFWETVSEKQGACGTALERGERIIVEDVAQSPIFAGTAALDIQLRAGVRAVQSTPLVGRSGRLIGVLSTHYRAAHRSHDSTLRLLDLLARHAADVIEREQVASALREQQSILEGFYNTAPFLMGIAELDGDRTVAVSGNRAMAEFLGYTPESLRGRSGGVLGNPPEIERLWLRHYRIAERDRVPVHFEYEHPHPGRNVWLSVTVCYIGASAGGRPRFSFVAEDVTARKQHENALSESEDRFRAMADGAPVMIWVIDSAGRLEFVNRAHREFFGTTPERLLAPTGWRPVVHPDDRASGAAFIHAVRTGQAYQGEARLRRADGEWRWIFSQSSPRFSGDRKVVGHVGCSYDITEAKELRALEHESARQKDQFIAILAHELRNPLAPIRLAVAMLRTKGPTDPLVVRYGDVIERQATHMSRLLDDLLDVSRLSRGALTLQRAPVVLRDAIEAALDVSRPIVEQQRHNVNLHWRDGSIAIDADSARLTQAIGNLLLNAAKYTPSGGTIGVTVGRDDGDVVISVRDNGIGMDADMLATAFDLFTRGANGPAHGTDGLGIGLALARRLVELHRGTLQATSAGPGLGSEFVVRLPGSCVIEQTATPATTVTADASWRGRRVLVVDDNVDVAEMLNHLFGELGAEVRTAHDGASGWRAAEEFNPHVILLDLGLPAPDGYEVCRRIRAQSWGSRVKIVALTGWGQDEDRRRTEAAGFDAHIVKPVDAAELLERLRTIEKSAT